MPGLYAKKDKLIKKTILKINRLIAGFLILIMVANYLGYLPLQDFIFQKALAQAETEVFQLSNPIDDDRDKLGLIAILVESDLLNDFALRSRIMTYADSAQQRIPHSKSFVIGIDKNESTFRIASILEKLYFEGIDTDLIDNNPLNNDSKKDDDNRLIGVVVIGDVPIPVVHESNGLAGPSLYPYTDFYRKGYIFDHEADRFTVNEAVSTPTPEVWHGVIVPPDKDPATAKIQLIEYFDKNYEYTTGNTDFSDFEKRLLYANFPEMERQMNYMDYKNYGRYLKYMEEFMMYRFNKHLLKEFIEEVSADMGSPDTPIMDEATLKNFYDVHTETVFKKYAYNLAEALKIYRSGINEVVTQTGRWEPKQVDSPESLITMRDEYGKYQIKRKQLELEDEVNDFVGNNLNTATRQENIITLARLNVKLKILDIQVDSNTFDFYSFFDGQRASEILVANQCGIQVGQAKQEGQTSLENNSVLVKANRMYNPATQLSNPNRDEDWEIEEDYYYKLYGGCVFDNAFYVEGTGRHPSKCAPGFAQSSLYDIVGSIEKSSEETTELASRCDTSKMTFKLTDILQYFATAAEGLVVPITIEQSLAEVIDQAYAMLLGNNPDADPLTKGSYVIQRMIAGGEKITYSPMDGVEVELSVSTQEKLIDTLYSHVEPTNETIKAIKHIGEPRIDPVTGGLNFPQITTPSTPADGIRYISFARNGIKQAFEYLNLFRINGNNPGEITGDLLKKLEAKQQELNQKTTTQSNLFKDFFVNNSEIIEPLIWKASSTDQKLQDIIPKYLDRDSFMPSPYYNPKKSPQNKPNGYEVIHIVADGDTHGYQFGLNRAMLARAPRDGGAEEDDETGVGTGTDGSGSEEEGDEAEAAGDEGSFLCGDPAGVEIWEWFDSLQCWINEEILPAAELFKLDNSCTAAPIPPEEEADEDIFDALLPTPKTFDVEMKRKSLVSNQDIEQEERIVVTALDESGNPVLGYIDMPVHLELTNPDIGEFSANDVYIYEGERGIDFTAKDTGSGTLTITMGNLPARNFDINVFDKIDIDWSSREEIKSGRSEFTISVALNGGNITNINDTIQLAPLQPADGGFENGGQLKLINGRGEIKFVPTPGKQSITLISKDPYITGEFVIHPTAASATKILLRHDPYIPIGTQKEIQVIAADSFGFPGESFNKTINVRLTDKSKGFASLESATVTMNKGVGTVKINAGKESADITLIADHEDLQSAKADIPLLARVDSEDWKDTYPQNLFASFVGFPAGDFTQEDYFGGTHLFGGKTEAVYSFLSAPVPEPALSIAPNHLVTTTGLDQAVFVEFPGNELLLQVFDQKTMQTLIGKKTALSLNAVERYEGETPEIGKLYLEMLSNDYAAVRADNGYEIKDYRGDSIASLKPNSIRIIDTGFKWIYETNPEYNALELRLSNGLSVPARIIISLPPEKILPESFEEISPNLKWNTVYGGKSTNDPTGLVFFAHDAQVPETVRAEFYGFEELNKYLSLFASGTNVGDAVKFNMPVNAVLLGDPTIKLPTKSTSSLNYNSATGEQIYADPEGKQIVSINHLNFNNDTYQDAVLLTEDGRVRLLEGGPTEPPYVDKGNLALLADGGIALETIDFKKDNYEDLLIATDEGRLAILHNDKEVITRTDQKLNIGKKIYKILESDMDKDGYGDLVILDSRGDIYIFYFNSTKGTFPENGKWIGNYGYSLKLANNLNTDLDIRYNGIPEPSQPGTSPSQQVVPAANKPPLEGYEIGGTVNEAASLAFFLQAYEAQKAAAENPTAAAQGSDPVPKLPWPEGEEAESYFAPIESINGLNVVKRVSNKDRPGEKNVDLEETLTYTIEINSGINLSGVIIADTVPDSLTFQPDSVTCVQGGCTALETQQNGIKVFFSGLNLTASQKTVITYDVFVAYTPKADILVSLISEPNENLPIPGSIIDQYMDVLVSPPYNNTGKYLLHYSTGPRSYSVVEDNDPEPPASNEKLSGFGSLMNQMSIYDGKDFDEDNPPPEPVIGEPYASAISKAIGNDDCLEDAESATSCIESGLDDIAGAIAGFSCVGAGCLPMPFNRAFLVPPEFPLPVFAFPTTLPTPVGPIPVPSVFGAPSVIGMASIPGPIMSAIRFYIAPTLTAGLGMAMCWGPYPQAPAVPPPVWPVPYPPPIGNCMVTAINPLGEDICNDIRDATIEPIMDAIRSGINKINSTANDINNNPDVPMSIDQGGAEAGAGGLEISLAVDLGDSTKFDAPAKSFSNTHIPAFDSLGGVLSGWFDRQTLEIQNKLLTLPTFSIYLPDIKSLFALDWAKTEKQFESWKNVISGSASATGETLKNIEKLPVEEGKEQTFLEYVSDLGPNVRGTLDDISGSKALKYANAVQTQASIYNLNALEGLYDVASSLPLVKLTEKPINFDIPWLSPAEIQAWIIQAQNWVIYYEREYERVKDKWEQLTCEGQLDDEGNLAEKSGECVGRHLADMFGVNFDPMINSVKENIEVLKSYLDFPKKLVKFKQQLADYIRSVACYINEIAMMMGGWLAVLQQQMVSWAELILTIIEIIKNIEDLFDLFTDFDANCDICTNERYANFGWWMLLGLVLPDIPIIQFPKIPDIVLDMSKMDMQLDIELPILKLRPKPIPLPPLPYIRLPDLPTISILLTLPPLPILPSLPELPDLPDLPPLPTIDLPTLPAPPKLPDVAQAFEMIIPIIEKILEIWCIMKKSFAPVPEQMLNDQITLLTNRPAYLIPLDLIKIQLPNIALFDLGFNELRIETIVYLGLRVNVVSKPLEEWAETWNGWIQAIPDEMNQFYQEYIIEMERKVQEEIDKAEAAMEKVAEAASSGCIQYDFEKDECTLTLQQAIDESLGEAAEEADAWLRDREAAWQDFADEMELDWTYEEYYAAVRSVNEKINSWKSGAAQDIQDWFAKNADWIQGINYLIPAIPVLEYVSSRDFGEDTQEVLTLVAEKLNQSLVVGPWVLARLNACLVVWPYCKDHQEEFFGGSGEEASAKLSPELPKENKIVAQVPLAEIPGLSEAEYAQQIFESPQGQEIRGLLSQVAEEIRKVNEREPVDYKVLKEQFGIADYLPSPRETTVDKLRLMEEQLIKHSDRLLAEADRIKNTNDLTAIAGVMPREDLPFERVEATLATENSSEERSYTNALPLKELPEGEDLASKRFGELQQQIERVHAQNESGNESAGGLGGSCGAAVCLPDPITGNPVPLIPNIDLIAFSETLFMPNGHIVYSDGTGLYLKRDLTVEEDDVNTNAGNPRRFTLDEMAKMLWIAEEPKEAVNMLQSTFTENGASTFNWKPTNHPDLYGYGIELERTITGYDANRQSNELTDTKIILLPPDAEGKTPEVLVNGQTIEYGTLITSLTDEDDAVDRFGVRPKNIVTGAKDVRFPTINNALIKVSTNKAVYFDQLEGSAYSMSMENGYYQIKMTWFDQFAGTANYNQNEIIAPQLYAGSAEPIDISQTDTYYMPIFKEKTIKASEIFVDLAGAYRYYWFINPETNRLTPQVGSTLTIPPQEEAKTFKVKLVATQNLEDASFETFEKTFTVKVYVPQIELDPVRLSEGIIAGSMTPIPEAQSDDLSEMPFSVFRKRLGTWKNVGILHAENPAKSPTSPALGEKQSYYSTDAAGTYRIEGFEILDPSPIELKDQEGNTVAQVDTGTGLINLFNPDFDLKAVPGGTATPTHIAIIKKETGEILGNVYYMASAADKVSIVNTGLNASNVAATGTTVGDANMGDDIVAANIPDEGPSFPGGVAIFEEDSQTNVALVDKDGTIRMMKAGYDLMIKNRNSTTTPYIFQIVTNEGDPIFDVFIQADFENLQADTSTIMDNLNTQIGLLPTKQTAYAQMTPVTASEISSVGDATPVPQFQFEPEEPRQLDGNPFPDVDETHPYFNQILDLYKNRVISGYADGSFKPDQKLTRAEFIKIAMGVTNCLDCTTPNEAIKEKYLNNPFPDVSLPSWFFYCIAMAKELGMITGYGDGLFRPENNISRAEAAAVLLRQSGIELTEAPENAFLDVPDYAWYVDYVYTAVQIGLIKESFGIVNPDEEITRGEFAFMAAGVKDLAMCRLVDTDDDKVPDWWEMTHDMDLFTPDAEKACPCSDNPWPADTDGDGTRDICDLDIDNDGVLNPMCILTDTGQVDSVKLLTGLATLGEAGDNCIFIPNPDQADFDEDDVGDICDEEAFCPCSDNPNLNDTDGDGIRDVCDTDIDNDGILHSICIFDDSGLFDLTKLTAGDDNCVFVPNPDQTDTSQDGFGDACEVTDLCPQVPEDMDGVDDEDGCPEVNDEFPEKDPGVYVTPGELCSLLDFSSDFIENDAFMTAITDLQTHEILFSKSAEIIYTAP